MLHSTTAQRLVGVLIAFVVFAVSSSIVVGSGIPWESACPIDWSFFRCAAPPNAAQLSEAAAIFMEIQWNARYAISTTAGQSTAVITHVTVANMMDPSKSWVVAGHEEDSILDHEQCHFDLNEVYRRKLELSLSCVTATGRTPDQARAAVEAELHAAAQAILSTLDFQQRQYDQETSNGRSAAQQSMWESRVAMWLNDPRSAP